MTPKLLPLAACSLLVAAAGWLWPAQGSRVLRADPPSPFADSDNDFLPDSVEWACLTNPLNADTDQDGVSDFIEVVQHGAPRRLGYPVPPDHELCVVIASTPVGNTNQTWMHLLFRFMGNVSLLTYFRPWVEFGSVPGLRVPLDSLAMSGGVVMRERDVPNEGHWVDLAVPIASETALRSVLPFTIGVDALIGDRLIHHGSSLFAIGDSIVSLVPYGDGRFAVQSISQAGAMTGGSNRVCVLTLNEVGSGQSGIAYEIVSADCDDCNDLECGASCQQSVGWVVVIPGGVDTITGGG